MADFGGNSNTYDSAVEELISQAKDLYVLEQVAAINLSGFTNSSLPTNLETRFRRLKSLPTSKPEPVKNLARSKTIASRGTLNFEDSILKSSFEKSRRASFCSNSGKIGSKQQTLEVPKEKLSLSSSSFTSSSNPKSKLKLKLKSSSSWLNKLAPLRVIGCLWSSQSKSSSSSSNKTTKISNSRTINREKDIDFNEFLSHLGNLSLEEQRKILKNAIKETKQIRIKPAKFIKTTK